MRLKLSIPDKKFQKSLKMLKVFIEIFLKLYNEASKF